MHFRCKNWNVFILGTKIFTRIEKKYFKINQNSSNFGSNFWQGLVIKFHVAVDFWFLVQDWVDIVPQLCIELLHDCQGLQHCSVIWVWVEILPKSMPWPGPCSAMQRLLSAWLVLLHLGFITDSWITKCLQPELSCQHCIYSTNCRCYQTRTYHSFFSWRPHSPPYHWSN